MPRYSISHRTSYRYSASVIQSNHLLHLAPRPVPHQEIVRHNLIIEPAPAWRSDRTDYFGNPYTLISLEDEHKELTVNAINEIIVNPQPSIDLMATVSWESLSASAASDFGADIAQFTCASPFGKITADLHAFALPSFPAGTPVLEGARRLMERIFTEFRFDNATTDIATPLETVLKHKSGVCQDFAHLQIAAMRSLGLPCRYVSGYIRTYAKPGEVKLEGTDASHAWVSAWAPETGWVDFDPTNNLVNSPDHIAIAYGRDFGDVSPISGVLLGGGDHAVAVAVDVKPVAG